MVQSKVAIFLAVLMLPVSARAALVDPANFSEAVWLNSPRLQAATGMAWAPDGSNRLFVIKQFGEVVIIKDGVLLPIAFANVTPIYTVSECGLVGIAFDPNFLVNKYVYLFVTVSGSEQQIIRYTVNGDTGVDKTTVVDKLPTAGLNHDGGAIGFGRDGKLYWAIGDLGTGTGVNQDLTSLAAKVGRANADGTPVADNPFADGAGPQNEYVWARGFRNPFTFSFQPATGLLFVNDVGASREQILAVRRGDHAGWNMYQANQPQGFIRPVFWYATNREAIFPLQPAAMSGAARAGGTVTFTTTDQHFLRPGQRVKVFDVPDESFNGNFTVRGLPSETSFTVAQPGPDAISGGGRVNTVHVGGAVTGGTFYNATEFPAAYRGNYFFGDFNSGWIERMILDDNNNAADVAHWTAAPNHQIDIEVGPDGALYYLGYDTLTIYRGSYKATTQGVVVSPAYLWMTEGRPGIVSVRLALDPGQNTTVSVARASGDADLTVQAGASLTFTSANWRVPQTVTLAAGRDLDSADDLASFAVSAGGLTETILVFARDQNDGLPPVDAAADAPPDAPAAVEGGVDAPSDTTAAADSSGETPDSLSEVLADAGSDAALDGPSDAVRDGRGDGPGSGDGEGCGCRLGAPRAGASGGAVAIGLVLLVLYLTYRGRQTRST
jgi:glucose/arabinose dehydrogenase